MPSGIGTDLSRLSKGEVSNERELKHLLGE